VGQIRQTFDIKARDFIRAGHGAMEVQRTLKGIGYPAGIVRRVAVCAYESEMNVVMYGSDGRLTLVADTEWIVIEVEDKGEGIENIELALKEGYSTASEEYRQMGFGAGMGLPNIRRKADDFEIRSHRGGGTFLRIRIQVTPECEESHV